MNGRPVIATADARLVTITAGGHSTRVLAGDTATVLGYVAARFHAEVEPLTALHGWRSSAVNAASGGISNSNHLSATALDLNGAQHPRYRHGTFTDAELAALRRILADLNAAAGATVVRWGGDWGDDVDEMHIETVGSAKALAKAAAAIRAGNPNAPTVDAPAPAPAPTAPAQEDNDMKPVLFRAKTGAVAMLTPRGLTRVHNAGDFENFKNMGFPVLLDEMDEGPWNLLHIQLGGYVEDVDLVQQIVDALPKGTGPTAAQIVDEIFKRVAS